MDGSDELAPLDCSEASWRLVRPSECRPAVPPPDRVSHGRNVSTDAPHIVLGSPGAGDGLLRILLPGTGSQPLQYSCLLRGVARAARGAPVIGLSYAFLPPSDAARNSLCARHDTATAIADCLGNQHADALFGGHREPDLWPRTAEEDSVAGRLALLLRELAASSPRDGWDAYLSNGSSATPLPRWDRIWVGGHSQGGGHAGYLASEVSLAGATMLSGPQDACIGCADAPLWLDRSPWATSGPVTAFAHGNESAVAIIRDNWRRLADSGRAGSERAASGLAGWAEAPSDASLGLGVLRDASQDAPTPLPPPPWLTWAVPSRLGGSCYGRPQHCSTGKDSTTPVAALDSRAAHRGVALYELAIWPALWGLGDATPTAQSGDSITWTIVHVAAGAAGGAASLLVLLAACCFVLRRCRKRCCDCPCGAPAARPLVREHASEAASDPASRVASQVACSPTSSTNPTSARGSSPARCGSVEFA